MLFSSQPPPSWRLFLFSCSDDAVETGPTDQELRDRVAGYLKPLPLTSIRLEVDQVAGKGPNQDVIDLVTSHLGYFDKPVSVDLDGTLAASGDGAWTFAELQALATASYGGPKTDDEAVLHVMFVDGRYAEHEDSAEVLGVAWENRHVVLFADTLQDACTPDNNDELKRRGLVIRACNATVAGTWLHEIGHVIGLVNNGLDMVTPHNDPNHPTHDADPDSLMYWQFDVAGTFDLVRGKILADEDPIPPLSAACLADIDAIQTP